MPIKILDPQVIAQIAAGEVVERPASVVKELVENALDAGATQVTVEVKGGGVNLIRVSDNGSGMAPEEAELAFQRHATSKISRQEDLFAIASLGFRGEALPSIAAVARVEVLTCPAGAAAGSYLSLVEGRVAQRISAGRPPGATVTVTDLFGRVPARLKFLKSTATENGRTASVVSQYALARPEVAFTLTIEGRLALKTPGRGRLLESVIEVYGAEAARQMLPIGDDAAWDGPLEVAGLAGSPSLSRSGRDAISLFVNRRWVTSRLLAWAVEEAYHGLLMAGKHPVAVVDISLPPQDVDVNIHPAKAEVKFRDEKAVFGAVQRAVRRALVDQMAAPRIEEVSAPFRPPPATAPWPARGETTAAPRQPELVPLPLSLPALRVLGQAMGCYIVAEGPDGLYLIDQHAAHERIVFDQVQQRRLEHSAEVQGLLEPATFEVDPRRETALRSYLERLAEFGFLVEPFGGRSYLVRAVPRQLGDGGWAAALEEALGALAGEGGGDWAERVARSIACHAAVRGGQTLSLDEMRGLVRQLEQTANPHTCPHGRPTVVHLSPAQLRREFGRG
ncbi:MAG: DNA mismatch repair endonuclease MutL [Chloroflexi bacterium]|nr:DNA mismatch repair endonuclease MutL [Chloroflexota bacterium]